MDKPRANIDSQDPPQLRLGGSPTFPLIIFFVPSHGASTQMSFVPELSSGNFEIPKIPKILKIGPFATLEAHTFVSRPLIEVSPKAKL
jgi:hypothetical protein